MLRVPPAAELALFATLAPLRATADILLAHGDGAGPHPTIQAVIDAAVDGDEVHLAAGDYVGDNNRGFDFSATGQ